MDTTVKEGLWRQFGATIDTLANALDACPPELWHASLWDNPNRAPEFAQVWYLFYHALFWLDLYLTGAEEGFVPPAPFSLIEQDYHGPVPARPYTKAELQHYLVECRKRCYATIAALTDETAARRCSFGWGDTSFFELLLYNMRHTQEHASQLNLFIGGHGVDVEDYVTQATDPLS